MEDNNRDEKPLGYNFDDFLEDEIKDAAFKVSLRPGRFYFHIVFLLIPVIFYIMFWGFLYVLEGVGMADYAAMFKFFLFLTFVMGICFFVINCGKEVIVSGHGIVLRSLFIINESISVHDVERCEVITGLTTHGRYHTEHYSKAVIYYGDGRKFSVTDNMYKGWNRLVRYMEMNNKVVRLDGRNGFQKALDDMIGGK